MTTSAIANGMLLSRYLISREAVPATSSCCQSMICFSLLLKIIPLLAMSVAAYTDAVMLFVGPSHYWRNSLLIARAL